MQLRSDMSARTGRGRPFLLFLLLAVMAVIYLAVIDSVGWSGKVALWLIGVTAFVIVVIWRWAIQGKPILPRIRVTGRRLRVDNKALIALVIIALVVLGIVFRGPVGETMTTWAEESAKAISTIVLFMVIFGILGIVIAIWAGGASPQIVIVAGIAGACLGAIIAAILVNTSLGFEFNLLGDGDPWWWPFLVG